ncbi:unnamed protein product [Linum trigynum]|uniref:Uncharacterized protein n=1 Tax=Linum trigynum TaxID=586398 RepID=A0AAV2FU94_9ROSI
MRIRPPPARIRPPPGKNYPCSGRRRRHHDADLTALCPFLCRGRLARRRTWMRGENHIRAGKKESDGALGKAPSSESGRGRLRLRCCPPFSRRYRRCWAWGWGWMGVRVDCGVCVSGESECGGKKLRRKQRKERRRLSLRR